MTLTMILPSSHSMSGNHSAARNGGGPARPAGRQDRVLTCDALTKRGLDVPECPRVVKIGSSRNNKSR